MLVHMNESAFEPTDSEEDFMMRTSSTFVSQLLFGGAIIATCCGVSNASDFDGDGFGELVVSIDSEDVGSILSAGAVNVIHGGDQGLAAVGSQFWHQDAGLEDMCEALDRFGEALAVGDFNGDSLFDLAVGTPREDIDGDHYAGVVNILYGAATGLETAGNQLWIQGEATPVSGTEPGDLFGSTLASGDFNSDGCDDLAIGAWQEAWDVTPSVGAVVVLYGSSSGLSSIDSDFWLSAYLDGEIIENSMFGNALAVGDFDNDGHDDLAIGAQGYAINGQEGEGAVFIAHGGVNGLRDAPGDDCWHQGRPGVADDPEFRDYFGGEVAAGDLNGDGFDELVVGVPREDVGSVEDAGMIHVLYGSASGINIAGSMVFHQDSFDSNSPAEVDDRFGAALTVGDFNRDRRADLAVGVGYEDWGTTEDVGMVNVLWGTADGVTGEGALWLTEERLQPGSPHESHERFGISLAAGDLDGDGYADLAIGATGEDRWDGGNFEMNAGAVFVITGATAGLSLVNIVVDQCSGIPGGCEADDSFGSALVATPGRARDLLFGDGFESGDTSSWSAGIPQ